MQSLDKSKGAWLFLALLLATLGGGVVAATTDPASDVIPVWITFGSGQSLFKSLTAGNGKILPQPTRSTDIVPI